MWNFLLLFIRVNRFPSVVLIGSKVMNVEIATYNEIIESIVDTEVLLIDVREPSEITASGCIPTSINIPRKKTAIK